MKKYILLLGVVFLMPLSVFADDSPWSGSLLFGTDYTVANGQRICGDPVFQADISYEVSNRVSVNLWGSTDNDSSNPSCGKEVDLTGIIKINDNFTAKISHFDIGRVGTNDFNINSYRLEYRSGKIFGFAQYLDPHRNDAGYTLHLSRQLFEGFSAGLTVGEVPFAQKSYVGAMASYTFDWEKLSFNIRGFHAPNGAENQKHNLTATVTYRFKGFLF